MRFDIDFRTEHDVGDFLAEVRRIRNEADFSQVVLEGINAIQKFQRQMAPTHKFASIPRSIHAGKIIQRGNVWSAESTTSHGPAIFTNEGTGTHGPSGSPYQIIQRRTYQSGPRKGQEYEINITHPGIRGTHWWERGAEMGSSLAIRSFQNKVERILRVRG